MGSTLLLGEGCFGQDQAPALSTRPGAWPLPGLDFTRCVSTQVRTYIGSIPSRQTCRICDVRLAVRAPSPATGISIRETSSSMCDRAESINRSILPFPARPDLFPRSDDAVSRLASDRVGPRYVHVCIFPWMDVGRFWGPFAPAVRSRRGAAESSHGPVKSGTSAFRARVAGFLT